MYIGDALFMRNFSDIVNLESKVCYGELLDLEHHQDIELEKERIWYLIKCAGIKGQYSIDIVPALNEEDTELLARVFRGYGYKVEKVDTIQRISW